MSVLVSMLERVQTSQLAHTQHPLLRLSHMEVRSTHFPAPASQQTPNEWRIPSPQPSSDLYVSALVCASFSF